MKKISREVTPISMEEFYLIQNHYHAQFDYPIHFHPEYEINLVFDTHGKRFIANSVEVYKNIDIALIGSNVLHAWTNESDHNNARVVTLQFSKDFLGRQVLDRREMEYIKNLLEDSKHGVVFTGKCLNQLKKQIIDLTKAKGFSRVINFLLLLDEMSNLSYRVVNSSPLIQTETYTHKNSRILDACDFIKKNYQKKVSIKEVADMMNMTPSAFSHFFKKKTYRSFTDYIIDIRVSHACQMLQETDLSISQISEKTGFYNVSNFNKIFKLRKKTTPKEFRKICQERQIRNI